MKTFRVWREAPVTYLEYAHVEAENEADAIKKAEEEASDLDWKDAGDEALDGWRYFTDAE